MDMDCCMYFRNDKRKLMKCSDVIRAIKEKLGLHVPRCESLSALQTVGISSEVVQTRFRYISQVPGVPKSENQSKIKYPAVNNTFNLGAKTVS